jgi:hypothetical protein
LKARKLSFCGREARVIIGEEVAGLSAMHSSTRSIAVALVLSACLTIAGCVVIPIPLSEVKPAPPRPTASDPTSPEQARMLFAHNKCRAEMGEPPLYWSGALAKSAQNWAEYLATTARRLQHSETAGVGENLAMWTTGSKSPSELIALWTQEKFDFTPGVFPAISRTGEWHSVDHYTQIIWKDTAQMGCGLATGGGNDFLVCQYSPQGNIIGERVY